MGGRRWAGLVTGASAALLLAISAVSAAGEKYATFGADLTPAERTELSALFGVDTAAAAATVATPEMVAALRGTGLPAAPTDKSISSSVLTCANRGDGLTVRTQNITRISAPVYANALVTAGVGDGTVLIAAPAANPVTGETALVGVLKAFPQCQAGRPADPARVALAYEQIARTINLAGSRTDLNTASTVILAAAQPVITGQLQDDAAIGTALDQAAAAQGLPLDPVQRAETVGFLKKLGGLDYGSYARGYQVQQASPTEVRVVPAGAGAPAAGQAPSGQASSPAPVASATANGEAFTGTVERTGEALTVKPIGGNQDGERQVTAGEGVTVTRNGRAASFSEIRPEDTVSVTTNPDGTARRIDATSPTEGANPWTWLAPLLGLLLLGLLAWWLISRRRDDFILTPKGSDRERAPGQAGD